MKGKTVLIVDDDEAIRELVALALASNSVICVEAASGECAIQLAEVSPPDVIVCDMHMDGLSGEETIQRLRTMPRTKRTPVILISGHPESSNVKAGPCYLLPKPFTLSELVAVFQRAVSEQNTGS